MPTRDIGRDATNPSHAPERKLISVLFADIRGSTELIFGLDPEEALARLEPVIRIMVDAVHRFEGVVSNRQGDGVMALFGAPFAADDHAARACFAALQIQKEVAKLREPNVRIGVHSGEVVLQHISHDLTSVYDAAGPVAHLAQKIQAEAPPGRTLISDACVALTGGIFETRPFPKLRVGGSKGEVSVSELVGPLPISRWQARAATGLSPFVGRIAELRILDEAAAATEVGASGSIVIEGEAGAGKSRLANEFVDRLRARGWNSFEIAGELTSQRTAWQAVRRLLLAVFGKEDEASDGVAARLNRAGSPATEEEQAALRSLLGLPAASIVWRDTAPERRRRLMLDAFVRTVTTTTGATNRPTALFIDDVQWIDPESSEAMDALVKESSTARLLVVATRRTLDGSSRRSPHVLALSPLARDEASLLLDGLVGENANLERLKRRIIDGAGGVPLFLEEVVRHLAEIGVLAGMRGEYDLRLPTARIGIPPTVRGVISARIDRLSEAAQETLQIASVFGDPVVTADVAAVANASVDQIDVSLAELTRAALMTATTPEAEVHQFAHDLIREVAYSGMVRDRRRILHRLALDHLALGEKDASESLLEALHRQAVGAEEWSRAVAYARLAAAKAIDCSAYRSSLGFIEAALAALDHIEPTRAVAELEIDLRLEARIALGATADLNQMLAYAKQAETKAQQIGDSRRVLSATVQKASALIFLGAAEESLSAGEAALKAALAARVPQIELVARYILAQSNYTAGRYRAAADLIGIARGRLPEADQLARMGTTGTTLVLLDVMEAIACAWLGEFQAVDFRLAEAVDLATKTARPYDRVACAYGAAVAALQYGQPQDAIAAAEPALKLVREFDLRFFFPLVANQLGFALVAAGRAQESFEPLHAALKVAHELEHIVARANIGASLGYAMAALGRDGEAEDTLVSALQLSRQHGFNGVRITAARFLAEVVARRGNRSAEAERLFSEAIDFASTSEARPSLARCKLAFARFRLDQGDFRAANLLMAEAAGAFEEMAMERDLAAARSAAGWSRKA